MEEVVHRSLYSIAKFDSSKKLYTLTYLKETESMTDNDWMQLMKTLKVVTDKLKPWYILDDNRNRLYAYPPEMQEWTLNLFIEDWYKNGLKKYVQVLPIEFVSKLSAEQIVDLANIKFTDIFETNFVTNIEDAKEWLFNEE